MYLSDLKITGFKSFPNKTELKFSHGVTCIIGPNGCGKSNIVDSIRWVIGEQRSGALRSDKMTDVIFNGAKNRKAIGFAEVSLTIVNDRNILPSEYSEVTLTRRLFRDSSSEYLINGAQCRLKDIQNLFMDTGMGSDAYSVIELKMVEQILSTNHSERRLLFEEAAGIKKYKQRRKSAEKKLSDTKQDLLRVQDILDEVENKVNKLSKQVEKARKFKEFKERLLSLELESAAFNFKNIQNDREPLEERLDKLKLGHQDRANQISLDESLIENYKAKLLEIENELSGQRQNLHNHDEKIRMIKEQELISTEKAKNSETLVQRLLEEVDDLANRKGAANDIIAKKRKDLEEIQIKSDSFDERFRLVEEDYNQVIKDEEIKNSTIQKSRLENQELKNKLNKFEHEIEFSKKQVEQINQNLSNSDQNRKNEIDTLIKKIKSLTEEQQLKEQGLQNEKTKSSDYFKDLKHLESEIKKTDEQKKLKEKEYLQLESKRNILEDSLLSGDFLPDSTKRFLEFIHDFPSFLGIFSEIIRLKENTDLKIEQTLETFATYPVLSSPGDDELLKLDELNLKLSVLIIKPENFETRSNNIIENIESDILSYKELSYLFANWQLLASFDQVLDNKNSHTHFVSEKFEYSPISRIAHLKGENKSEIKLLSIQKNIENYDLKLEALDTEINDLEKIASELEEKEQGLNGDISASENKSRQIEKEILELNHSIKNANFEKEHLLKIDEEKEQETKKLKFEKLELEELIKTKEPIYESLILEEQSLEHDLKKALVESEEIRRNVNLLKDRLNELKIEKSQLESNENSLKELLKREYYFLKDSDKLIEDKKREIENIKKLKNNMSTESEDRKLIISNLLSEREGILAEKSSVEDNYVKFKDKITDLEQAIKQQRKDREEYQEKLRAIELKLSELNVKATSIAERIYNEHQLDVKTIRVKSDFELLKAEREIFSLKNRITALGEVNSLAIEEYEKEKERYDFLKKQYDDLIKAEDLLTGTIKEINKTAQERFQQVFEQIRKNFQLVFQQFFQRGEADLSLLEHEDPLEGRIEIKVRPKGRALQTLTLMSGGEKTLTAISLLFAIYLVKPSPFCILDEVDAPLDDINITRFSQAIRSFTDKTQFIIITHNKRTMEAADFMYGVTQEEEGISKIVSVKFD